MGDSTGMNIYVKWSMWTSIKYVSFQLCVNMVKAFRSKILGRNRVEVSGLHSDISCNFKITMNVLLGFCGKGTN